MAKKVRATRKAEPASPTETTPPPLTDGTRRIGLSLGADLCWPLCYEGILRELNPTFVLGGERVKVEVERVAVTPYRLSDPCPYDVVLDRLTHWYKPRREWIKKAILMDGLYVFNNPWSLQSMEKHTTYAAMTHLGLPVPDTAMVPPKAYEPAEDLRVTLQRYARLFDLGALGEEMGFPLFMKPYDGGAWKGVSYVPDAQALRARYEESGTQLMHLQKAVAPFEQFVRCIGLGPQTTIVRYDPDAPLHNRYCIGRDGITAEDEALLQEMTLTINTFFGWDFNSCESLLQQGVWHPIDFANACPDSQVTSLHYHFPWLVLANLRWSLFCAVTRRPMRRTLDWEPYYAIAAQRDLPFREKLRAYAAIARERLDAARFEEFCAEHLGDLEEIAWQFFGSEAAKDAIRQKVASLYPAHEIEPFTELFWQRVQAWRQDNPPASRGPR